MVLKVVVQGGWCLSCQQFYKAGFVLLVFILQQAGACVDLHLVVYEGAGERHAGG